MRAGSTVSCRRSAARSPGSRPRSVRTCQGLRPRRVVQGLALTPPSMLPSAYATASAPGINSFAAQWLAYALPCRRFTVALTDASARLGADVDRYSFIVVDSHHLLLAGLPGAQHTITHGWAFRPYEGRGWRGFHHHATLCIAAYGFLIAEQATIPPSGPRSATPFQAPRLPDDYRPRGSARAA